MSDAIKITLSFSYHYFEVIAFWVGMIDELDSVMGAKLMYELEANPRFLSQKLEFT